jgi:serine protease Do
MYDDMKQAIGRALLGFAYAAGWLANVECVSAQSSAETIAAVSPKVVKIFGAGGGQKLHAYGSGFLVSPNGHIVTVWSHILDGDTVTVVLHDGRRFQGKVVGAEPPLDMAVLKIDAEGLPHFDLAQAASVGPGTRVLAFSNAFKVATGDEPVTVMHGVISARTSLAARRGAFESPYTGPVYVVDAVTNNSGAAGGVLTTWDGRLLGMIGKELRNTQTNTWLNYVMPTSELKTTIEEIISGRFSSTKRTDEDEDSPGRPRRRRYEPLDFGIVTIPDVLNRTPAYIDRVLPGSQAEKVGLLPNDLILFVGEDLVQSCRMLKDGLGRLEANDLLKVVVRRGDTLVSVEMVTPRKTEEQN